MDEKGNDDGPLAQRITQLERERDDLQKDIEQLCMQQAGPSYLAVATRMHFQRTAGLEQEIENLRNKLAARVRENQNLQEELSEAFHIKSQLADLHSSEVKKNLEAEKQIKFFQGCVASAFAERDYSIMEAEKAKEQGEALSEKLCDYENRLQEVQSAYLDEKKTNSALQMELKSLKQQSESLEKVVSKFYEVREKATGLSDCKSLEAKCSSLLDDPFEMWIFDSDGKHAPSTYVDSLEEQLKTLRESMDSLQKRMRMGMEIEQHLRKKVQHLERKMVSAGNMFRHCLSTVRELYSQQRSAIMNILEEENNEIKLILVEVQEKMCLHHMNDELNSHAPLREGNCDMTDCEQGGVTSDTDCNITAKEEDPATLSCAAHNEPNSSDALARALKEKVEALLLLSQQEERHLLERDTSVALQKKIEDLQRNLVQVTNEKVTALVQLSQLKKEYQLLQASRHGMKHVSLSADDGDKSIVAQERNTKLKNLLKKTYLSRWVGKDSEIESDIHNDMDLARLKVENATLQESITNIGHLASSIHKLRVSLIKVIDDSTSAATSGTVAKALDDIFHEVGHIKTALSGSLPVSCSSAAAAAAGAASEQTSDDPTQQHSEASEGEQPDPMTAAGLEMVELLILAAERARENMITGLDTSVS